MTARNTAAPIRLGPGHVRARARVTSVLVLHDASHPADLFSVLPGSSMWGTGTEGAMQPRRGVVGFWDDAMQQWQLFGAVASPSCRQQAPPDHSINPRLPHTLAKMMVACLGATPSGFPDQSWGIQCCPG
jgi:hypothetical protein